MLSHRLSLYEQSTRLRSFTLGTPPLPVCYTVHEQHQLSPMLAQTVHAVLDGYPGAGLVFRYYLYLINGGLAFLN